MHTRFGSDMSFDDLHDDEIILIFERLPYEDLLNARQVCKRWRILTDWEPLWYKLDVIFYLFINGSFTSQESGNMFANRCIKEAPVLGSLEFRQYSFEFTDVFYIMLHNPRKVLKLNLSSSSITDDDFIDLLRLFGDDLREINMQHGGWSRNILWNEKKPKHTLRDLPMLSLLRVDEFNPSCIHVRASAFPNLQELHLTKVREESLLKFLENQPELSYLRYQLRKLFLINCKPKLLLDFPLFVGYFSRLNTFDTNTKYGEYITWRLGRDGVDMEVTLLQFSSLDWENFCSEWGTDSKTFNAVRNLSLCFMRTFVLRPPSISVISRLLSRFSELKKLTIFENCNSVCRLPRLVKSKPLTNQIIMNDNLELLYYIGCDCGCLDAYRDSILSRFSNVEVRYEEMKENGMCFCGGDSAKCCVQDS